MTRIITVTSAKGGVGKTTVTSNLGFALSEMGKSTIIMDGNLTTPNLGLHLGISLFPKTLHDVLKGNVELDDAIYHHPSGLRVIPAGLGLDDLRGTSPKQMHKAAEKLVGAADVVLVDAAAGLGRESLISMEIADEIVVVTNPEVPAVTDALKLIKLAEEMGTHVRGVVVNKKRGVRHELSPREVEMMLETPIISEVPHDNTVSEALAAKTPVLKHDPHTEASYAFRELAADIIGVEAKHPKKSFWQRVFGI